MYAVFEDGSRQYRVAEGDVVKLDYRDADVGSQLEFGRVLLFHGDDTRIGRPTVEGARVVGEVIDHPSTKLYIQHFRRRKNYRRLRGHRQPYTAVRIRSILLPGMQAPAKASPPPASEPPTPAGGPG
jgi:large subunit ribosomal protein L21